MGKCCICDKTTYQLEGLTAGPPGKTKVYHKLCFKCATCGWQLNLTNYKFWDDQPYCKNHYPVTGFGDSKQHVHGVEQTDGKLIQTALNAPKLDTYNQTVRVQDAKSNYGQDSIEIKNAKNAPKLDTFNQTVINVKK